MAKEREGLIQQAMIQGEPNPQELAQLFNEGSPALQLLGFLLRQQEEVKTPFFSMDLSTDESLKTAIKTQGKIGGRQELLDQIIDLIIEGSQE